MASFDDDDDQLWRAAHSGRKEILASVRGSRPVTKEGGLAKRGGKVMGFLPAPWSRRRCVLIGGVLLRVCRADLFGRRPRRG